jgi:hypothetical protein
VKESIVTSLTLIKKIQRERGSQIASNFPLALEIYSTTILDKMDMYIAHVEDDNVINKTM